MKKDRKEELKAITDKLEQGIKDVFASGKYEDYLQAMGKFHRYSVNNCILIAMQCPMASMVAGYKLWKNEFGRQVKKGEHAIRILAPMTRKVTRTVKNELTGEEEEQEVRFTTYRSVPVFDISQTEGPEVPMLAAKLTGDVDEGMIERAVAVSPVPVRFEPVPGSANGFYSHDGYIVVDSDNEPLQRLKTLVHEIAHATIHCKDGGQAEADRATKEVQAESIAYTVCSYLGLDTSDYSFGYVAGWSSGKELDELKASLEVIRTTAGEIIDGLTAKAPAAAA